MSFVISLVRRWADRIGLRTFTVLLAHVFCSGDWRVFVVIALLFASAALEFVSLLLLIPLLAVLDPEAAAGLPGLPVRAVRLLLDAVGMAYGLGQVVAVFFAAATVRLAVFWLRDVYTARFRWRFVRGLRLDLYSRLTHASWPAVIRLPRPELRDALTRGVDTFAVSFDSLVRLLASCAFLVAQLVVVLVVVPPFLYVLAPAVLVFYSLSRPVAASLRRCGVDLLGAHQDLAAALEAYLSRLKPARVHRAAPREYRLLEPVALEFGSVSNRTARVAATHSAVMNLVTVASLSLFLLVAHYWFAFPVLRLGMFAVCVLRFIPSLVQVVDQIPRVALLLPQYRALIDLRDALSAPDAPVLAASPSGLAPPCLHASGAVYSYESGLRVPAAGFHLDAPAGSVVLLQGPSGIGKTTCLDMIGGLFVPAAGVLDVGGRPAAEFAGRLGYLQQSSLPVCAPLREHLASAGGSAVSDSELLRVLSLVALDRDLHRLGLDTPVGPGASDLSGGQWRRLDLAAVLLRRPALLLLDEPTAGLDPSSADRIVAAVLTLAGSATIVVASHDSRWRAAATVVAELA